MYKNTKNKNDRLTRKEKVRAGIIAFVMMLCFISISIGWFANRTIKEYREEHMFDNLDDGIVMLPDGTKYDSTDGTFKTFIENYLDSPILKSKDKKKIIEYLNKQGIDTKYYIAYLNGEEYDEPEYESIETLANTDNTNTDNSTKTEEYVLAEEYKDFLVSEGFVSEDADVQKSESGLSMLNGRTAMSYPNLHQAETAFGERLGLYFTCDSLKNYEMVGAYTVETEFLQCVYAVNQDGSAIREGEDIESEAVTTLTVKLSKSVNAKQLIKVYDDYTEVRTEELDDTVIHYCGDGDNITLVFCDRPDGRAYSIHSVQGIDIKVAQSLVNELFSNLILIEAGEQ